MIKLVFDSGHSEAPKENSREDEIDNIICNLIQKILFDYNCFASVVIPVITKEGVHLDLNGKWKFANDMKADAYISIHCNWCEREQPHGFNIFYDDLEQAKKNNRYELGLKSQKLAYMISARMQMYGFKNWGKDVLPDTRAAVGNLAVCSYTLMPAVLIELVFLSNFKDASDIEKRPVQEKYAIAISKGIVNFFV